MASEENNPENMDTSPPGSSELAKPVYLPINAVVRIFSFLRRDDLDRCQRVSKMWNSLIDGHNNHLPKREIECLVLTTDHEFRMTSVYEDKVEHFAVKKYFGELDIDGFEVVRKEQWPTLFDTKRDYHFSCGERLKVNLPQNFSFLQWDPMHNEYCSPGLISPPVEISNIPPRMRHHPRFRPPRHLIHKSGKRYGKKLFTPPLSFYEHLAFVLRNCRVKNIVFHKFTFTELFVEKFMEYVGHLDVEMLYMHNVKLRYVSPETFHRFFKEAVFAQDYVLEHMRYVLPNHVNSEFMRIPSVKRAKSIYVDFCSSRAHDLLTLNISPQAFLEIATYHDKNDQDPPVRRFFAVANSRINDDPNVLTELSRIYRRDYKSTYYNVLLIGGQRLVDGVAPNPIPRAQQPAIANLPQAF